MKEIKAYPEISEVTIGHRDALNPLFKALKGLARFVVKSFSTLLPRRYAYISMEQDLGDEGLRKYKESYRPSGFVRKFRVMKL